MTRLDGALYVKLAPLLLDRAHQILYCVFEVLSLEKFCLRQPSLVISLLVYRYPTIMANYASTPIDLSHLATALLRLSPLMISSASLMCAWDQQNAFRSFLAPQLLRKPGDITAHVVVDWFAEFAKPTKWVIILSYPFALVFAFINAFWASGTGLHPQTKAFYIAGGILSILHFYFGTWSMMWNARISSKEHIGVKNYDALRGWLANNAARMCWVNIPAWVMFVCATATFVQY